MWLVPQFEPKPHTLEMRKCMQRNYFKPWLKCLLYKTKTYISIILLSTQLSIMCWHLYCIPYMGAKLDIKYSNNIICFNLFIYPTFSRDRSLIPSTLVLSHSHQTHGEWPASTWHLIFHVFLLLHNFFHYSLVKFKLCSGNICGSYLDQSLCIWPSHFGGGLSPGCKIEHVLHLKTCGHMKVNHHQCKQKFYPPQGFPEYWIFLSVLK